MSRFRKDIGLYFSCVVFIRFCYQSFSGHIRMNWEAVPVINLLPLNSRSIFLCLLCDQGDGHIPVSPLPAGTMLSLVSRGCWRDTGGASDFLFQRRELSPVLSSFSMVAPSTSYACSRWQPLGMAASSFLGTSWVAVQWNADAEAPSHEWPARQPMQQVQRHCTSPWVTSLCIPESWFPSSHTSMAPQAPQDLSIIQ